MAIAFMLTTTLAPARGFKDVGEDERLTVVLPNYPSQPITVRVPRDPGGLLTAFATGFATEEDAYKASSQMQSVIRVACITTGTAIDVGTVPRLRSGLGSEMREVMKQKAIELGQAVHIVNHVHGVQVFEDHDLPIRYFHASAVVTVQTGYTNFIEALKSEASRQTGDDLSDARVEIARDLFMAADIEQSSKSRFLTLVTALEVLARRDTRSAELQAHIDSLITLSNEAQTSAAHPDEMEALINALHREREQSITSAIKELARTAPRPGDDPDQRSRAAAEYYAARSKIVHDGVEPEGFDTNAATSWVRDLVRALVLPGAARVGTRA